MNLESDLSTVETPEAGAPAPESIDLLELSDKAKVSPRTIRYYIQQGLLPKPEARGPGAHYTDEHLDRLLLIKRLQREHLPLAEIRRAIESGATETTAAPRSALDYVRGVLGKSVQESVVTYSQPSRPTSTSVGTDSNA